MNHAPLVSVILPVYNGAEFVGAALESALSQTYRHLEIIAIDDGSTDGTRAVLDLYALRDSRIRVLTQANSGVARARKGEFDRAIADFSEAIRLDPSYAEALSNRALAYEKKGELGKAEEDRARVKRLRDK